MVKRNFLAIVLVFIVLSIFDLFIHGTLLKSTYEATASLWRSMDEMKMPLMAFVTLVFTVCFVSIYDLLVREKSLGAGIKFGVLFGLATSVGMGFGSYTYLPIPLTLAWSWFLGSLIEVSIAGVIVGAVIKS